MDLDAVPPVLLVAFGAACAHRVEPAYRAYARVATMDQAFLGQTLERLWSDLKHEKKLRDAEIASLIAACIALVPEEDPERPFILTAVAEHATAATAYALRARQSFAAQEAAWAARRAYEAADQYAIRDLAISQAGEENERLILSHPVVQAELERQRRDLIDIHEGLARGSEERSLVETLHQRATREHTVSFE